MEIQVKVQSVQIDFLCPKCKIGYLRPTGICHLIYPAQYPHICNHNGCGYSESFTITYPYIDYKKKVDLNKEHKYFSEKAQKFDWPKFIEYVNTYDPKIDAGNRNKTIIHDILFGIGLSLDQENFEFYDGYKKFKNFLKEIL